MFQVPVCAVRAKTLKDLFILLNEGGRILAGGTDIIAQAKEGAPVERMIDITGISELRGIAVTPKKVSIGATASITDVMTHPVIRAEFPALVMACDVFASPQIRNRATLSGNIANASPAGDTLPALYSYDAVLQLRGKSSKRSVPIIEFILAPRKTLLVPGEIIVEITLNRGSGDHVGSFIKMGQRKSLAISKAMVSVAATRSTSGTVKKIGIALGAVAPTIIRLPEAEELFLGKKITPELAEEARRIAEKTVRPIDDIRSTADYRRKVSGVIVQRALLRLASTV